MNKTSFCFQCKVIKYSRVHHCRKCGKCVKRMDHHCYWTGNCVGRSNVAYFFIFLTSSSLSILSHGFLEIYCLSVYNFKMTNFIYKANLLHFLYSMIIASMIFYLFIYQTILIYYNVTTVEDFIKGARKLNTFNKGFKTNFREIILENLK